MASIGSPLAGPIININARTVSRSVISGGGGGATGDPETSAIVKRQTTDITLVNKNIGVLAKRQSEAIAAFQQAIGTLTQGLNVIRVTVQDLSNKLNVTNNLLATDTKLEQQQDLQEQKQEKVLAEQGARAGKESLLERKIQSALLAPVRFVAAQTQSILERLKKFFTTLLLGWLTNQLIETLKANAEGNKTKLQQIFDAVLSALNFAGRGLYLISRTFGFITKTIFGVTKLVAKLTAGVITGLFKGIWNLGKVVTNGAKSALGIGTKVATKAGTEAATKAAAKGGLRIGLGAVPIIGAIPDAAFATMDLMQGKTEAAMYGYGAAGASLLGQEWLSIPLSITAAVKSATTPSNEEKKAAVNKNPANAKEKIKEKAKTETIPANSKTPSASNLQMPALASQSATTTSTAAETTSTAQSATPAQTQSTTSQTQLQATPAQTQSLQTSLPNIGPAPQAQPNVVMMSSMAGGQPQEPQMTSSGGAASDVPAISSSNPSNFYTLYSQVNYNVVM
jgi:hypothetical protein